MLLLSSSSLQLLFLPLNATPSLFLLLLFLPLRRRPAKRKQLCGPRVQGVLEPLDPPVVELDLLAEAGELAVALGEAGGELWGGVGWLVEFFFPE